MSLRDALIFATENAIVMIDAFALAIVILATLEAFVSGVRFMFSAASGDQRQAIWVRYARWLVAALTFQLAADIIQTSVTTSWDALGRIAAVAFIRTFLNYFLERDVDRVREQPHEKKPISGGPQVLRKSDLPPVDRIVTQRSVTADRRR